MSWQYSFSAGRLVAAVPSHVGAQLGQLQRRHRLDNNNNDIWDGGMGSRLPPFAAQLTRRSESLAVGEE